jgi:hypothetical protein
VEEPIESALLHEMITRDFLPSWLARSVLANAIVDPMRGEGLLQAIPRETVDP